MGRRTKFNEEYISSFGISGRQMDLFSLRFDPEKGVKYAGRQA